MVGSSSTSARECNLSYHVLLPHPSAPFTSHSHPLQQHLDTSEPRWGQMAAARAAWDKHLGHYASEIPATSQMVPGRECSHAYWLRFVPPPLPNFVVHEHKKQFPQSIQCDLKINMTSNVDACMLRKNLGGDNGFFKCPFLVKAPFPWLLVKCWLITPKNGQLEFHTKLNNQIGHVPFEKPKLVSLTESVAYRLDPHLYLKMLQIR